MPTHSDIIAAIEASAPARLQESWDNTGWQTAPAGTTAPCTGVMLCLDVTPDVVAEATAKGCNLIVSHHPLIFKGLLTLVPGTPAADALLQAVQAGVAVYSCHTAIDSAPGCGISRWLGTQLGLLAMEPLEPSPSGTSGAGLGVVGNLPSPGLGCSQLLDRVKEVYGAPRLRVTAGDNRELISRVALCSGSGGEFIETAWRTGAQAYITSDVRYHDFLDWGHRLLIIDTSHYESEICVKKIFNGIISRKFPNFAIHMAACEHNPVTVI